MSAAATASLAGELRALCGAEHVVEDAAELSHMRIGAEPPAVAVTPGSADEIAAILRVANEHGQGVLPAGGCTQQTGGLRPKADILLYTTRLTEIEHYDPADLTIGIGAGCTAARLSSKVAVDNLFFAGDPALPERSTIGGLLATGTNGPHRHGYGGVRDYCIGIRFVTGEGRKAKGGGRVVKNVAGYDMMKLLIGSYGTLAVITSASFKLFPAPRQTRTFVADFATSAEALKFRDIVMRSPLSPMCLEIVSPGALGQIPSSMASTGAWLIAVRASGSDAVLARYRSELGSAVTCELDGDKETELWRAIANFPLTDIAEHGMLKTIPPFVMWMLPVVSLHVPLAEVGDAIERLNQLMTPNVSMTMVGRVGIGHLLVVLRAENPELPVGFHIEIVDKLRGSLSPHASLLMRSGDHPSGFWPMTPTNAESMRVVKSVLDPRDILNRGRFLF